MMSIETIKSAAINANNDANILAGNIVGPSNTAWQDVAGTLAVNLRTLADGLDAIRNGEMVRGLQMGDLPLIAADLIGY